MSEPAQQVHGVVTNHGKGVMTSDSQAALDHSNRSSASARLSDGAANSVLPGQYRQGSAFVPASMARPLNADSGRAAMVSYAPGRAKQAEIGQTHTQDQTQAQVYGVPPVYGQPNWPPGVGPQAMPQRAAAGLLPFVPFFDGSGHPDTAASAQRQQADSNGAGALSAQQHPYAVQPKPSAGTAAARGGSKSFNGYNHMTSQMMMMMMPGSFPGMSMYSPYQATGMPAQGVFQPKSMAPTSEAAAASPRSSSVPRASLGTGSAGRTAVVPSGAAYYMTPQGHMMYLLPPQAAAGAVAPPMSQAQRMIMPPRYVAAANIPTAPSATPTGGRKLATTGVPPHPAAYASGSARQAGPRSGGSQPLLAALKSRSSQAYGSLEAEITKLIDLQMGPKEEISSVVEAESQCLQCRRVRSLHPHLPLCNACIKHNQSNVAFFRRKHGGLDPSDDVETFVLETLSRFARQRRFRCTCDAGCTLDCNCVFNDAEEKCVPCRFIRGVKYMATLKIWPQKRQLFNSYKRRPSNGGSDDSPSKRAKQQDDNE